MCITDLDELKQRLRMVWAKLDHVVIVAAGVVDSSRSVKRVLYTVSCSISHMLLSTGFKSGEFGLHSWGRINSGVSFCNNSTVAYAQWAFQVLQGSVETLFTWGGKRLHHFAANLFRKRYTKFHQKSLMIFVGDITRNILVSFFLGTVYIFFTFLSALTRLSPVG